MKMQFYHISSYEITHWDKRRTRSIDRVALNSIALHFLSIIILSQVWNHI